MLTSPNRRITPHSIVTNISSIALWLCTSNRINDKRKANLDNKNKTKIATSIYFFQALIFDFRDIQRYS
ncbi:hypothetical protein EYC80_007096 [Monilinia laxa]|uniref:Uncharacterized protein n=1 Tax=Monilinia laxa TaxID=61186 RepID=A0A5N6K0K1_MONLA|nr:hypothetical protein EYC80_007096 [Monilinia laxa]